jgi:prevent-host-death family protein
MKTANIATAKNQFSRLIQQVKRGETILITERDKPVARILPLGASDDTALAPLLASGVLSIPLGTLDLEKFCDAPRAPLNASSSLTAALLTEREEGR